MAKTRNPLAQVRPHLLEMKPYEAVEPPEALARRAGIPEAQVVKLNANENPYGPSPKVPQALASLDRLHIYPDPQQVSMRRALAGYVGLGPEHLVVGNGSDEIIDLLLRAFVSPGDAVIDCPPTFGMYPFSTNLCGGRTVAVPRDDRFRVDVPGVLEAAGRTAKAVLLASPNNPTGNGTPVDDVLRLLEGGLPEGGLLVVMDEAYAEFGGESVVPLVPEHPNLVVLRTLSKWAGLAGLRIGYGVMAPELVELLLRIKPPYNVSQTAEAALLASLDDLATLRERVALLVAERERMRGLLASLPGVTPWPSDANFLLCELPQGRGRTAYEGLARRGVFVRYFGEPRLRDFLRISVGTPQETDRLVGALAEALRE